jgi:ABC-type phosphate/phosphonate transport system substrate-binding protein
MIASLPMYDFLWTARANDALWDTLGGRLRDAGVDAPARLTRGVPLREVWRDPELIFGQTCGYPFWTELHDRVTLLATPLYAFDGCDGAEHRSFLIARRDDPRDGIAAFRGGRAAINARDSNSGMNLFRASVAPFAEGGRFFSAVVETGAHAQSLVAVVEGAADLAALDCVSFALLRQGEPAQVERVRVVARTPRTPALPFVASAALSPDVIATLRRALFETLADPGLAKALAILGISGAARLDPQAYARVADLERGALQAGYPELA